MVVALPDLHLTTTLDFNTVSRRHLADASLCIHGRRQILAEDKHSLISEILEWLPV